MKKLSTYIIFFILFVMTSLASCSQIPTYYGSRSLGLARTAELGQKHAEESAAGIKLSTHELEAKLEKMRSLTSDSRNYSNRQNSPKAVIRKSPARAHGKGLSSNKKSATAAVHSQSH